MNKTSETKLNLDDSWRIGEASFEAIIKIVRQKIREPNIIVEFGSGASSIRLANQFTNSQVISLENNLWCWQNTRMLATQYLQSNNLDLLYRKLEFKLYGSSKLLSYEQTSCFKDLEVDCVLIDGPPFFTIRGREACLYQIYQQLKIGGIVILDDFKRRDERTIVENWLAVYPNSFSLDVLSVGHGLAILQKVTSVKENWSNLNKLRDNIEVEKAYNNIQICLLSVNDDFIQKLSTWQRFLGFANNEVGQLISDMKESYSISNEQINDSLKKERFNPIENLRLLYNRIYAIHKMTSVIFKGWLNL